MKFLDRLKTIGFDLSKLTSIKVLNFSTTIDRSIHIHADGAQVDINPGLLPGKQRRKLQVLMEEFGLPEAGAILNSCETETVDSVRAELPQMQRELEQFVPIVPTADIPMLHACLYLKRRFNHGNHVDDLKSQISKVYGPRGRNFANLCTAGYLEDWFLPLHRELLLAYPNDPVAAKTKFLTVYNLVVTELPWTVFICSNTSKAKAISTVVSKINRNLQNGVRFLNLHGLGDTNAKKIASILPEIQKETGAVTARMEQDSSRIFVRLEVPQNPV